MISLKFIEFDLFAFADYSGAADKYLQRRHIVLAVADSGHEDIKVIPRLTRPELTNKIRNILFAAQKYGQRVLFGLDHNFSFPLNFAQQAGFSCTSWRDTLYTLPSGETSDIRQWAVQINHFFQQRFGSGIFWGPGFPQRRKPDFPFAEAGFSERRLIEQQIPRMQPVFKLGGIGSVGLQSLYGMIQLKTLIAETGNFGIPVHFWPFDGFEIPPNHHVGIEIYPALYNKYQKRDLNDAIETARYFRNQSRTGELFQLFKLNPPQRIARIIEREGWLPGIPLDKHHILEER